jgi:hypothetical protein
VKTIRLRDWRAASLRLSAAAWSILLGTGFGLLLLGAFWSDRSAEVTGYSLFALIAFLALFRIRKMLSMLPLGRAIVWTNIHIFGGAASLPLFLLHTKTWLPSGVYERVLAALFFLVFLSGLAGLFLTRLLPSSLANYGVPVIYERIGAEIARLRHEAERLVVECTRQTRSQTLAEHYVATLAWYFARPRFFLGCLLGRDSGRYWIRVRCDLVARYLNTAEREFLQGIRELGMKKETMDVHYAKQKVLKHWLSVHVPLTVSLLVIALWHLVVVRIYG